MNRRDPLRVQDYLGHILEAIDNIIEYTSGMDSAGYLADKKTRDAVIRNFEVIGEACNKITQHYAQFAASHPEVPWNFAYEMRNALAHGYFKVDQGIVWTTIQTDLPQMKAAVFAIAGSV
ncbi:DUF86 domain-containing protein [Caenimonas terrae]|uniref:DUF86 domain-containing protein n=1 Tax=Caenimonas terrae TaxID=696074 RepID=A0ABW0NEJ6_9BURK